MKVTLTGCFAQHPAAHASAAPALKQLDLEVAQGEQVAIIGPSGAGKTTLLQVMACALKPIEGKLLLDQRDPWRLSRPALQRLRGQLFWHPRCRPCHRASASSPPCWLGCCPA